MSQSSARKQEMGLQVVQDIAVDNIDARLNPVQYERVTINEDGHIDRIPCMPLVYRYFLFSPMILCWKQKRCRY